MTDPLGHVITVERDAFGRPIQITDATGGSKTFMWSVEGKLLSRTTALGEVESFTRDPEGNPLNHTETNGGSTAYTYGPFDFPATRTTPDGATYAFTRDTELRLTQVTNPLDATWEYTYDPVGRLVAESDFDNRTSVYTRDAAGQLLRRTNSAGQSVTHTYDALGRLTSKVTSEGGTSTYTHDLLGRTVAATSPDVELSRNYDPLGNLLSETVNGHTISMAYDSTGQLTKRITPAGQHSAWTYLPDGSIRSLVTDGRVISFEYDAAAREAARRIGDNLVMASTWDVAGRLTDQTLTGPDTQPITARRYSYRADGYLTGLHDQHTGPQSYALDATGRPTVATSPDGTENYAYDPVGNQTTAHWPALESGAIGRRAYQGMLLTRSGDIRYEHDQAGRITVRQKSQLSRKPDTWRYFWNAEDQLTRTVTPDGTTWVYAYDPFGRRVSKRRLADDGSAAELVRFAWHHANLAEQTTVGTSTTTSISWNHQELIPLTQTEHQPGQEEINRRFYAIVTDLIGTPTDLVDEDGAVVWQTRSSLWGATTNRNTRSDAYTPLRFPGQYADEETGWHYNYHRHYDPNTGRYATSDPLGLAPSPNPYSYPHNPHTWTDPLGLAAHAPKPKAPESPNIDLDNYRGRFQADLHRNGMQRLPQDWDAHHAIPQEYRGHSEFADFDFDAPSNMRGLPGSRMGSRGANVHQNITNEWRWFGETHPNATRAEIEDFARSVDGRYGDYYWAEPR
jgi:RHS repeat-associated protein